MGLKAIPPTGYDTQSFYSGCERHVVLDELAPTFVVPSSPRLPGYFQILRRILSPVLIVFGVSDRSQRYISSIKTWTRARTSFSQIVIPRRSTWGETVLGYLTVRITIEEAFCCLRRGEIYLEALCWLSHAHGAVVIPRNE